MTLCIGWIRKKKDKQELILASDSYIGCADDHRFVAAPKLFPLKRGDCAIACAGSTQYSFPVVEHLMRAMELNGPVNDRAKDFLDIVHTIEDIINLSLHEETIKQFDSPDFTMILGGYSWRKQCFKFFIIKFNKRQKKMVASPAPTIQGVPFAVIGNTDIIGKVRGEIHNRLEEDGFKETKTVDMQPLDILMEYIDNKEIHSIAGYPQMLKIYPFMRTLPIGVKSRTDNTIYYYGRPLLTYETFPYPIWDLDQKKMCYMKEVVPEFAREHEEVEPLKQFNTIED